MPEPVEFYEEAEPLVAHAGPTKRKSGRCGDVVAVRALRRWSGPAALVGV